jgi:hypothetical protein
MEHPIYPLASRCFLFGPKCYGKKKMSSFQQVKRILESILTTFNLSSAALCRAQKDNDQEGLFFFGKEILCAYTYQSLRYLSLDTKEGCCTLIMRGSQLVGIEVIDLEMLTSPEVDDLEQLAVRVMEGFDRFGPDDPRPYGTDIDLYNF